MKAGATVQHAVVAQIQQPCPPPEVYVVPETPWAWIALTAVLFVLWLINAGTVRALRREREARPVQPPTPGPAPVPVAAPLPVQEEPTPERTPDYSEKRKELESALKGYGWKPAEVKAKIADLDLSLPVEKLIMQVLQGHAK